MPTVKRTKKETKPKAAAPKNAETKTAHTGSRLPHHMLLGALLRPHMSERAHTLSVTQNKYIFMVNPEANKRIVKEAIEHRYNVTVRSVNIVRDPAKTTHWRNMPGRGMRSKKAIVTVKAGEKIEIA
jgi:large subunit ribosomal protein L23